MTHEHPKDVILHRQSGVLELRYDDGSLHKLPAEYLRVYSPSAEVRGHGKGREVLQTGKRDVRITSLEPMGSYAIRPAFDDGHASGIYSWKYLRELGDDQPRLWQDYLDRLQRAGASREPLPADTRVVTIKPLPEDR
ncbi:MAG: DUF971 domain-containing protein [Pseudohongiellaceae bacterium]